LPDAVVTRSPAGLPTADALSALLGNMGFPCIVKPAHLGSSIGVGKAGDVEEVRALLPAIFRLDRQAVIEPFVPNLAEYNVAAARVGGVVRTSATTDTSACTAWRSSAESAVASWTRPKETSS